MSYQSFSRKKKKPLVYLLLIVVFVLYVVLSALTRAGILDLPVVVKNISSGTGNFFNSFVSDKSDLIRENQELKDKIKEIELKDIFEEDIYTQNTELLSRIGVSEKERVLFSVYSRPGFNLYDALIASGGDISKVSVGDTYYSSDFFALGRVRDIRGGSIVLDIFSSAGSETKVSINGSVFTAQGSGGGTMEVKVSRDFEVQTGDPVYLSGSFSNIIGKVKDVKLDPQDSFKVVYLKTPVNIFEVDKVEIEVNSDTISSSDLDNAYQEEILNSELLDSLIEKAVEEEELVENEEAVSEQ